MIEKDGNRTNLNDFDADFIIEFGSIQLVDFVDVLEHLVQLLQQVLVFLTHVHLVCVSGGWEKTKGWPSRDFGGISSIFVVSFEGQWVNYKLLSCVEDFFLFSHRFLVFFTLSSHFLFFSSDFHSFFTFSSHSSLINTQKATYIKNYAYFIQLSIQSLNIASIICIILQSALITMTWVDQTWTESQVNTEVL